MKINGVRINGSVFQKTYRGRDGKSRKTNTWFMKFRSNGVIVTKPTGTADYDVAIELLKACLHNEQAPSEMFREQIERSALVLRAARNSAQSSVGAASELIVAVHLMNCGYHVYRSMSPDAPCDLVAVGDGRTLRIEVKTASTRNGRMIHPSVSQPREAYDHLAIVTRGMGVSFRPSLRTVSDAVSDQPIKEAV